MARGAGGGGQGIMHAAFGLRARCGASIELCCVPCTRLLPLVVNSHNCVCKTPAKFYMGLGRWVIRGAFCST